MIVKKIRLENFRNIKKAEVTFSNGVNVLFGDNAEGKTNLLEGIYYASIGKSFRARHIAEMITFGEENSSLSLDFIGRDREQNISVRFYDVKQRAVEKNKVKITKMSELVGSFRAVLFCPEHLSLIKDGPAERRNFLDIAISSSDPLYLGSLQRYNKILKQRNTLIKEYESSPDTFKNTVGVWSEQLAKEAAFLARSRQRFIQRCSVFTEECFTEMTGSKEKPELSYEGPCGKDFKDYENLEASETLILKKLSENHVKELGAETTLYGIHKDDICVKLNGKDARVYCSQGQQRSLALALKLSEGELCREDCGEYPVFLFDDVLSELDAGRRSYLTEKIKGKQVILTTCEQNLFEGAKRIFVQDGNYTELD